VNSDTDLAGKKVLVLSDNETFFMVIQLNLQKGLGLEVVAPASSSLKQRESLSKDGDFDLIVVAMSSPMSEPVVALAKASLDQTHRTRSPC